ncbi:MAG TPA: chromate resistance protein ChrB domain-containing protein, partial [Candidatus Krumholzibacteria bacterium]|nr:chromate resistance protein ChrB domain-containing protein [Candidatus Krumholzibacteria bacterium]
GGIAFDMYGADLSHHGEDCTFETMIKRFRLADDRALRRLAEIVHDIDLGDSKFDRAEAAGLGAIVRGLTEGIDDDRQRIARVLPVFDGLYRLFGSASNAVEEAKDGKRPRKRARSKAPRRK